MAEGSGPEYHILLSSSGGCVVVCGVWVLGWVVGGVWVGGCLVVGCSVGVVWLGSLWPSSVEVWLVWGGANQTSWKSGWWCWCCWGGWVFCFSFCPPMYLYELLLYDLCHEVLIAIYIVCEL